MVSNLVPIVRRLSYNAVLVPSLLGRPFGESAAGSLTGSWRTRIVALVVFDGSKGCFNAMKYGVRLALVAFALSGCGSDPLVPGWMKGDWKCAVRDSNGNPYFGVDRDKQSALEKARWQCVSGSPYKQSCQPEPASCIQMD